MKATAMSVVSGPYPKHLEGLRNVLNRKLDQIDEASSLDDLRYPPGNRLKVLDGHLQGFYAIRVNDQYRIVFRWEDGAHDLDIMDYH
jgi:toxin HigB-1